MSLENSHQITGSNLHSNASHSQFFASNLSNSLQQYMKQLEMNPGEFDSMIAKAAKVAESTAGGWRRGGKNGSRINSTSWRNLSGSEHGEYLVFHESDFRSYTHFPDRGYQRNENFSSLPLKKNAQSRSPKWRKPTAPRLRPIDIAADRYLNNQSPENRRKLEGMAELEGDNALEALAKAKTRRL